MQLALSPTYRTTSGEVLDCDRDYKHPPSLFELRRTGRACIDSYYLRHLISQSPWAGFSRGQSAVCTLPIDRYAEREKMAHNLTEGQANHIVVTTSH